MRLRTRPRAPAPTRVGGATRPPFWISTSRLASVSPRLHEIYAEDGMTLEQLMAFSVTADHTKQEQVLCRYRHKTCYVEHAIMPSKVHTTQIRLGDCVTYSA